ncbi:stage III sporulation protein AG [Halalkalibacillus sediminis]|uniref:Stage III sporulation protein AG n=1 Tax=Halalkalibacillus sediminis TaxID=2018042 RepID=A0A2I0QXC1_9BACI|nr:stage III sporulation protein AG [Halalkalibacillus sediminis]PKR78959.1 stage III sporulation protein AG [Halalkalibacillus sediminis]
MFQRLKHWFQLKDESNRPSKKSYILLIGLIGLLFLMVSNFFGGQPEEPEPYTDQQEVWSSDKEKGKDNENVSITDVKDSLESELQNALENLEGISEVEVTLQLEASAMKIYEKNEMTGHQKTDETDQNGGTRQVEDETIEHQTVLVRKNNEEEPLLIQTREPAVRGVLVVAKGVNQIQRKQMVMEAVSRLLDVSSHRIAVMPKGKEE